MPTASIGVLAALAARPRRLRGAGIRVKGLVAGSHISTSFVNRPAACLRDLKTRDRSVLLRDDDLQKGT